MKFFRIYIHLSIKNFLKSFFINFNKKREKVIIKILSENSKKKNVILTSQCRVSLILVLKYLKEKYPQKNEIIFSPYNLPEIINVAKNVNFSPVFCDFDYNSAFFNLKKIKKIINNKTAAVVLTNMFNSYQQSKDLKKICKSRKVFLIEDNAIYFDNYKKIGIKKYFSGSVGDFTIYSFNIMKNISALYGGAVTSNNENFYKFANSSLNDFKSFPKLIMLKQILVFFSLKIMSVNLFYKSVFFKIIKYAHSNDILFLMKIFYPNLKFKISKFPNYYFTKISQLSKKLIYFQLIDSLERKNVHQTRKNKNVYYYKKINVSKNKYFKTFNISDFNYQNFIDFPILAKHKEELIKFLLMNGIEVRTFYYADCSKIFRVANKINNSNARLYNDEIVCLPNNKNISYEYIDFVVLKIFEFYKQKSHMNY